jgi:cell division septal protein FtsQ
MIKKIDGPKLLKKQIKKYPKLSKSLSKKTKVSKRYKQDLRNGTMYSGKILKIIIFYTIYRGTA